MTSPSPVLPRAAHCETEEISHKQAHRRQVLWVADAIAAMVLYVSPDYEQIGSCTCQGIVEDPLFAVNNGLFTCQWHDLPLLSGSGDSVGLSCMSREGVEQKKLQEQLHQAQKMETLGQLAAGVAHDFNNLLTIIAGYSEVILSTLRAEDPIRYYVQAIGEAGHRAALLTRQLLTFSRRTALEPKVVEVNSVVRETERLLQRVIGEDVALSAHLDPQIGAARIDPGQLGQVIMNLAVNAREAMPKGGRLTIETRAVDLNAADAGRRSGIKPGRYIVLSVEDTGSGMAEEVKARIFEPFFTTKDIGQGTGLGLATVQAFAKQSSGHIEVESAPDCGSTFRIFIPEIDAIAAVTAEKVVHDGLHGNEWVLLVEDDDRVREFSRFILQTYGYSALSASRGNEALELAEQGHGPIDLLVADVVMPGMSGPDLASRLQSRFPRMKVLFSSGYTDDAVTRHGPLPKQAPFLQKPYSPRDFVKKIRQVLDAEGNDRAQQ